MMHMSFWTGFEYKEFFFSSLNITSPWGMTLVCIVFIVATVLVELEKLSLATLKLKVARENCKASREMYSSDTALLPHRPSLSRKGWISLSVISLYFVEIIVGYLLMLAVMTYNVYIFVSVIAGTVLIYFLTGQHIDFLRLERSRLKYECSHCNATNNLGEASNASNGTDSTETSTARPSPSAPDFDPHGCCSSAGRETIEESIRV